MLKLKGYRNPFKSKRIQTFPTACMLVNWSLEKKFSPRESMKTQLNLGKNDPTIILSIIVHEDFCVLFLFILDVILFLYCLKVVRPLFSYSAHLALTYIYGEITETGITVKRTKDIKQTPFLLHNRDDRTFFF